jgi:hypothetical protein
MNWGISETGPAWAGIELATIAAAARRNFFIFIILSIPGAGIWNHTTDEDLAVVRELNSELATHSVYYSQGGRSLLVENDYPRACCSVIQRIFCGNILQCPEAIRLGFLVESFDHNPSSLLT